MIVKDNGKGQLTCRNVSVSSESVFKVQENNICNNEFELGQPFVSYEGIYLAQICWKVNQVQT